VIEVGGLREYYVAYGEERDLTLRIRAQGGDIQYIRSPTVVHLKSPLRNEAIVDYFPVRNTLLFDVLNVPHPYLLPRLAIDLWNLLRYRMTIRTSPRRLWFLVCAVVSSSMYCMQRLPVSCKTYRHFRSLPNHQPVPQEIKLNSGQATKCETNAIRVSM
jgi:GT2 family glycosyltransferase